MSWIAGIVEVEDIDIRYIRASDVELKGVEVAALKDTKMEILRRIEVSVYVQALNEVEVKVPKSTESVVVKELKITEMSVECWVIKEAGCVS